MNIKEIMNALNGNTRRRARTRFVVGTSIGALLGAAAGIMLTPKSGKEIRKDIRHGAEWTARKTREAARNATKFVKREVASVNDTVTEKVNDLKIHMKHAKEAQEDSTEKPGKQSKS